MLLRFITAYENINPSLWENFMTTQEKNTPTERVQSAEDLLAQDTPQRHLKILNQLISVTDKSYEAYYAPVIANTAYWMQRLPSPTEEKYAHEQGLFVFSFARAIATLKHRRASMLPIGADAETCYQQHDVWTYALFTAALLKEAAQVLTHFLFKGTGKEQNTFDFNPLEHTWIRNLTYQWQTQEPITLPAEIMFTLLKHLMPEAGSRWLGGYPLAIHYWQDTLHQSTLPNNFLTQIITNAETALLNKPQAKTPNFSVVLQELEKRYSQSAQPDLVTESSNTIPPPAPFSDTLSLTEQFIAWVKYQVASSKVLINHRDSWLYRVEAGLLLRAPQSWEEFKRALAVPETYTLSHLTEPFFVNTAEDSWIHLYYRGDWHTRQIISALLMDPYAVFDETTWQAIALDTTLKPDPQLA